MANLKEIRGRISSVKTTKQMTSAMKMVAAAKLNRAQDRITKLRPYAVKLQEIMGNIVANTDSEDFSSPYTETRPVKNVAVIVVTSNRGLCGAFNTAAARHAEDTIAEKFSEHHAAGNLRMVCIGKKGYEYFRRRGYNMWGENHDVFGNLSFETVNEVANMLLEAYAKGEVDHVELIYNEFKNVVYQIRTNEQFLPLASVEQDGEAAGGGDYIFEPSQAEILTDLIPKSLRIKLFRSVLESNAGEQGARMTAMDSATENADELLRELKLKYNQARQAAITTEILEIVAGAAALESGN